MEYTTIKQSIRYVQTENERVYSLANPTATSIPHNIIVTSGTGSVKIASLASSVVVQVNEKMNLFKSLLFAFHAVDVNGKPTHLTLGSITDEVKELFASATSTSDQARLTSLVMVNLVDDVSKETSYLSRAARCPQLSQTLVTYMLQSHYFNGLMDGNEDGLKNRFQSWLFSPRRRTTVSVALNFFHSLVVKHFSCSFLASFFSIEAEYNAAMDASTNAAIERMLGQPEEKRSVLGKKEFIKDRQETLDDVLTLISNIVVMGRYWINIDTSKEKVAYSFVLKLLVKLADTLSSVEFREFENKFKSVCHFMAHTLLSYIFDLFCQFVKLAQNPHIIRGVKASNIIP